MKDIFLLDMDDTLLDFPRAERANFLGTLGRLGVNADSDVYARFHAINDALWKAHERGEITRSRLTVKRFELLFGEYGIEASAEEAAEAYYEHFGEICYPFDGAREFLAELSQRGRSFIVTNGGARLQRAHIDLAGFGPYLCGLFISEEIGFHKPMPEFAAYVEGHIDRYVRERAVWIGDSRTSDMVCARSVGIDFLLFDPTAVTPSRPAAEQYAAFLRTIDSD